MLRNLKVLLGQTISAAGIQTDQATYQRAFADSFRDKPAGNIMAFSDRSRDYCMLTSSENMESTNCLLTEWTLKAGGHFKADSVFLIERVACKGVKDVALHLEREFGHVPKSVANTFADV